MPDEPDGGSGIDSGTGTDTGTPTTDAGTDAPLDTGIDVTCPVVTPDDTKGVYVSAGGVNDATCGTRAAPCKTISFGVTTAVATLGKSVVNVQRGVYVEQVAMVKDIEVIGGWDVTGTTWQRACVSPEDAVKVRAPANKSVTVTAEDLGGESKLTLMRVESKNTGKIDDGETVVGVLATGATTTLILTDVRVDVEGGGAGKAGTKGTAGGAAPASCNFGTGANGARGEQGAGADAGTFDVTGYTPGTATAGGIGTAAQNGAAGGTGTCVTCGTCPPVPPCVFVADIPANESCGKDGVPGCAAEPGLGGTPATGAGSSIGVFAWNATVQIVGGRIKSGDGGNGGAGGTGGDPGTKKAPR